MTLLGTLGTLALGVLFYILAKLSEKFGSVIKMPPIYRYYYLAFVLLIIGSITHLLEASITSTSETIVAWLVAPWFLFLAYHLPLAIGVTIGLIITWRYWSWLIIERNR
jgi:hypothetical protein